MSLPVTTPAIITHLTGLKNGIDFSTTFTDGLASSGSVYIDSWNSDVTQPTDAEILAAQDEVESLIKSQEYIEKRKSAFDSVGDQLDMLFHDMTADKGTKDGEWYKAVAKVKADNPKP